MKADELLALVEKMTPGPWSRHGKCVGVDQEGEEHRAGILLRPTANPYWNPKNVTGVLALRNHAASIITALQAERDALRADAERYRWLRDEPTSHLYVRLKEKLTTSGMSVCSGPTLDHEIDKRRAALGEPSDG